MPAAIQCPKCGQSVAVGRDAVRAQCFQCGTTVELAPAARPSRETSGPSGGDRGSQRGGPALIAIVAGIVVLFVLIGIGGAAAYWLVRAENRPNASDETGAAPAPPQTAANPAPEEAPPTATDEQRRLAATVPEPTRERIMEMYDQMRSSTDKKIPAMKGSYARTATDNMLAAIEDREITHMAALLQIDEPAVRAVIAVALADRAGEASGQAIPGPGEKRGQDS